MFKSTKNLAKLFLSDSRVVADGIKRPRLRGEELHHARIRTRRLMALLHLISFSLDDAQAETAIKTLQSYLDDTNPLRDQDVALELLRRAHLEVNTNRPRQPALARKFKPPDFKRLANKMSHVDPADISVYSRRQLRRLCRHVCQAREKKFNIRDLHRLRIRIKKCRYLFSAIFGRQSNQTKVFLQSAARLQNQIGKIHDLEFAKDKITKNMKGGARAIKKFRKQQDKKLVKIKVGLKKFNEAGKDLRKVLRYHSP